MIIQYKLLLLEAQQIINRNICKIIKNILENINYYLIKLFFINNKQINKPTNMSYSFLLKYIVIGDPSVGKSCILMQFIDKQFKIESDPTIGVEFGSKTINVKNKVVKLQIWDTAGQQAYQSITRSYYRGTIGAILVYDTTKRKSFNSVQKWIEQAKNYAHEKVIIIIVGNKEDLTINRQVSFEEGKNLADKNGMLFLQCSAKTGYNIDSIFQTISTTILDKIEKGEVDCNDESRGIKIGVNQQLPGSKNKGCC